MDKDIVSLIISIEEHLQILSQQIHEIKLISLATKDTLAQVTPSLARFTVCRKAPVLGVWEKRQKIRRQCVSGIY